MNRRTRRTVAGTAIGILGVVWASTLGGFDLSTPSIPQQCANRLGIHYTMEDGATEQLNAFQLCVSMFDNIR